MTEDDLLGFNLLYFPQEELANDAELRPVLDAFQRQNWDEAWKQVELVIKNNPNRAGAYFLRGNLYIRQGKVRRGIADANTAIGLNPNFMGAYLMRGLALTVIRRPQRALSDFNRAIEYNPASPEAILGRGLAWYMKGIYERRIHAYMGIIDYRYGDIELRNAIADFQFLLSAYQQLDSVLQATAHHGLAFAFFSQRQLELALIHIQASVEQQPQNEILVCHKAFLLMQADMFDEAIANLQAVLDANPKNGLARRLMRRALQKQTQHAKRQPIPPNPDDKNEVYRDILP